MTEEKAELKSDESVVSGQFTVRTRLVVLMVPNGSLTEVII